MEWAIVNFDELVHQTDDAYKLRIDEETTWLPKSVCCDLDEDEGLVNVIEQIAIEKGLI